MRKSPKFSLEVQERAVRMVFDAKDQYSPDRAGEIHIAVRLLLGHLATKLHE